MEGVKIFETTSERKQVAGISISARIVRRMIALIATCLQFPGKTDCNSPIVWTGSNLQDQMIGRPDSKINWR